MSTLQIGSTVRFNYDALGYGKGERVTRQARIDELRESRNGNTLAICFDLDANAIRSFRCDRMTDVQAVN